MQTTCDLCGVDVTKSRNARYANIIVDGKTLMGPWAFLCVPCHDEYGVGLGTGKGQKFDVTTGTKLEG